jgi:hypothetical protein
MRKDINLFSVGFEGEISTIKSAEDKFKELELEYKNALLIFKENKKNRAEELKRIRFAKLKEINEEAIKISLKLEKLCKERDTILSNYCKKNGHNYIPVAESRFDSHTMTYKVPHMSDYLKCSVCGRKEKYDFWPHPETQDYKQIIPDDVYDDVTLNENGRTYRIVIEEINKLEEYGYYLGFLRNELCRLFGHDGEMINYGGYSPDYQGYCKCCGKLMPMCDYTYSRKNAMYRIFDDDDAYLLSSDDKYEFSLPTFESYQESLALKQKAVQEKKDKPKKLTKKIDL